MIARLSSRYAMVVLLALAAIGVASPALPQTTEPSPAAMLLARQIVEIKGVKQMFDPVVRGVIEKAKNVFLQNNFMWEKDIDEIAVNMNRDFDPRANELIDATARIYASHFTEDELKSILTFYQSPLGQKMIVEEPKVMDQSMVNAASWADDLSVEVVNEMRAEMKKRGHDM